MKKLIVILSLAIIAENIPAFCDNAFNEKFREGTELYSKGKYQEALDVWLSLYKSGMSSSNLFYNIGNAYFKINEIPEAILFFERALLLDPADEDINYNLQIARTYTVDKFTEVPELFFITWYNFISLLLTSNKWALISISLFILFLILLSVYLFTSVYRLKVTSFWIALIMLFISLLSLAFSIRNRNLVYNSDRAIILCPQVNGKSSPDSGGNDLFLIHEGTKVTVTDALGEWNEIRLPDGNKGWIPENCMEKL